MQTMKLLSSLQVGTFVHPRGYGVYWALTCLSSSYLSCRCLSTRKISNMSVGMISGATLKWFVMDIQTLH